MGYRSRVEIYTEFKGKRIKKKLEKFKEENELEHMDIGDGWMNMGEVYWKMYADDVITFFQELADIVDYTADIRGEELRDVWQITGEKGKLYVFNINEKKIPVDGSKGKDICEYL